MWWFNYTQMMRPSDKHRRQKTRVCEKGFKSSRKRQSSEACEYAGDRQAPTSLVAVDLPGGERTGEQARSPSVILCIVFGLLVSNENVLGSENTTGIGSAKCISWVPEDGGAFGG